MAHQVERMFSVNHVPWHYATTGPEKTIVLAEDERPKTWDEARALAGLDWDPIEETPYRKEIGFDADGNPQETFAPVPAHKWITRSDTGEVLDSALAGYALITNSDMGEIIRVMMGDEGLKFETGGCLDGGRKVWAMLQIGDLIEIPGDPSPTAQYVALLNRHDGHGACKAIATSVRIVCANTWHYAETEADKDLACFSFHHRANWRKHMKRLREEIKSALSGAGKEMESYRNLAAEMSGMTVTEAQEQRFIDEFIYPTKEEWHLKPQALRNVTEAREQMVNILNSPTCEGIRGTAYGLLQAGGEFLDHHRKYMNSETYLGRTVFTNEKLKLKAKNIAVLAHQGVL